MHFDSFVLLIFHRDIMLLKQKFGCVCALTSHCIAQLSGCWKISIAELKLETSGASVGLMHSQLWTLEYAENSGYHHCIYHCQLKLYLKWELKHTPPECRNESTFHAVFFLFDNHFRRMREEIEINFEILISDFRFWIFQSAYGVCLCLRNCVSSQKELAVHVWKERFDYWAWLKVECC